MNIRVKTVLLFFLLFFLLIGCTEDTNAYIQDPISLSGDTAYYAAMDSDLRKTVLRMKHIEVSGIVSAGGYTTIFVGDEKQDGICFSCTFSQQSDEIAAIKEGSMVQLHGVCTGIIGDMVYLEHCLLTLSQNSPSIPPTTMLVVPNMPEVSVPPTTMPTIPPTTTPITPPTTEPLSTEPSTDPTISEAAEDMVWIPQNGKKYHIKPGCSGMKNPAQVTKEEAQAKGYTPCKKCYP